MSAKIGTAYDFSDIAGSEQVLWVCLSTSPSNDQIFILAPAVAEQPSIPAVEVQSEGGRRAWLLPFISLAVHGYDLERRTVASRYELVPVALDIDALMAAEGATDQAIGDLHNAAWSISQYFHADPERQVIPDIEDCLLVDEGSSAGSLAFAWRHDKNRRYVLRINGDSNASLKQLYDPGDDLLWPADAPLKVGSMTIAFAADGSTVDTLSTRDVDAIKSALGLKAKTEAEVAARPRDARPSVLLDWIHGGWRAVAAAALVAGIAATVILLQQGQVPAFEIDQAYATTDVRSGVSVQLGVILELRAPDVAETANYFAEDLGNAGITVTVEELPGDGALVTGEGEIHASDSLRELLAAQDIDLAGREFIEIAILPME